MRLLNIKTIPESNQLEVKIQEYRYDEIPPYATLSHRWGGVEDEVSYLDITQRPDEAKLKRGYEKLLSCCKQALKDNLTYIWIDTCCIDKASSAELSEAINSMFNWYKQSRVCYAYLQDVKSWEDHYKSDSAFRRSQWFTRGWTLQEMIAPNEVKFLGEDWLEIGQKKYMSRLLYEITKVQEAVLLDPHNNLEDVCVSQKMYWASSRRTTRLEDRAYSLLGLFNVSIPILYGEGLRAFARLQEEIIRTSFDHSIFAWQLKSYYSGLLAECPDDFSNAADIRKMPMRDYHALFDMNIPSLSYNMSNMGLSVKMPYRAIKSHKCLFVAFLACYFKDGETPIFIYMRKDYSRLSLHFYRTRTTSRSIGDGIQLSRNDIEQLRVLQEICFARPEKKMLRAMRPPLPNDLLSQNVPLSLQSQHYQVRLFFQGHALAVYPMADLMERNEVIIETEARHIWIASIMLRRDCKVWLLLAVIDGKLMIHLDTSMYSKVQSFGAADALSSCEEYYKKSLSFSCTPCSQAIVRPGSRNDSKLSYKYNNDEIINVDHEVFCEVDPKRTIFSLWLKVGLRKDVDNAGKCMSQEKPEPWYTGLDDLLKDCKPPTEPADDIIVRQDQKNASQHDPAFTYAHESVISSEYQSGRSLGQTDAATSSYEIAETYARNNAQKKNKKQLDINELMRTVSSAHSYNPLSEDSFSFNSGFATGYKAAHLSACALYQETDHPPDFTRGYAAGYASTFPDCFFANHNSAYIRETASTFISKSVTDRASAYAAGYSTGYLAGHASGYATRLDKECNEPGITGNLFDTNGNEDA